MENVKENVKVNMKENVKETSNKNIEKNKDESLTESLCCFCKNKCNENSQSCGRCNRLYTFAQNKPKFWWESEEDSD